MHPTAIRRHSAFAANISVRNLSATSRPSRAVGPYLGLRPRQSQSGEQDPELRITKAGDTGLRRLLVGSARYILGPFGPDTDLRRWGLALAARGKKNAKRRAVVAVARKLRAWSTDLSQIYMLA